MDAKSIIAEAEKIKDVKKRQTFLENALSEVESVTRQIQDALTKLREVHGVKFHQEAVDKAIEQWLKGATHYKGDPNEEDEHWIFELPLLEKQNVAAIREVLSTVKITEFTFDPNNSNGNVSSQCEISIGGHEMGVFWDYPIHRGTGGEPRVLIDGNGWSFESDCINGELITSLKKVIPLPGVLAVYLLWMLCFDHIHGNDCRHRPRIELTKQRLAKWQNEVTKNKKSGKG